MEHENDNKILNGDQIKTDVETQTQKWKTLVKIELEILLTKFG